MVAVFVLSACGRYVDPTPATDAEVTRSTAPSAPCRPGVPCDERGEAFARACGEASKALRAYLDEWRTSGAAVAARHHLTARLQLPEGQVGPRLIAGKLLDTDRCRADASLNVITFTAHMELHFEGDPMAWGEGENVRFVTATRASEAAPFRLDIATGP